MKIVDHLESEKIVSSDEAKLMKAALSPQAVPLPLTMKDALCAGTLRSMILALAKRRPNAPDPSGRARRYTQLLNVPNVFTQGAMKALVQAQISAASMGHEKMGSGHLLCGLCRVGDELTRCILGDLTARGD